MYTGSVYVGVNKLGNSRIGHGFVGFSTPKGSIEIHGQPLGGASPGGAYAAFSDGISIEIEERRVNPKTPVPHNKFTIVDNVPDQLVGNIRAQVLQEAKAKFGLAEYQIPIIDAPTKLAQNSNTVAQWALGRVIELLVENGIPVNPALDLTDIAAGLNVPGAWNDATDLVNVQEESNFLNELGTAIGTAIKDIFSGRAFDREGTFAGWADDGYSEAYKSAGLRSNVNADGLVETHYVGQGFFNVDRVYSTGVFAGQKYQPGGDYDKDGKLSSRDLAERHLDFHEKRAKTVADVDERKYHAEEAERYRKELDGKSEKESGSQSSKPILLDLGSGLVVVS